MIEEHISIDFPCIKVTQPIGDFFIASINSKKLYGISWADVRRIEEEKRDIETYLGIQRPLNKSRVEEIEAYVKSTDACFPTAVILAIPGKCAEYDEKNSRMILSNYIDDEYPDENIILGKIAKVLDGQHRIEGLKNYQGENFDVNVSMFIDIDIAEQAYIFSTVNLAQTKVNKSLVYDLYDLAKSRSPQKVCHHVAVALDSHEDSPLFGRIKRLGVSTEGRFNEMITQATFVESLLKYMTQNKKTALNDRDKYLRGKVPSKVDSNEINKLFLRNMMVEERDMEIADILWNYFSAIKQRWPIAWASTGTGNMLNRTNGFRALMRFLRDVYLYITAPGTVPSIEEFLSVINKVKLEKDDFTVESYKPGASGEHKLYKDLIENSPLRNIK